MVNKSQIRSLAETSKFCDQNQLLGQTYIYSRCLHLTLRQITTWTTLIRRKLLILVFNPIDY